MKVVYQQLYSRVSVTCDETLPRSQLTESSSPSGDFKEVLIISRHSAERSTDGHQRPSTSG